MVLAFGLLLLEAFDFFGQFVAFSPNVFAFFGQFVVSSFEVLKLFPHVAAFSFAVFPPLGHLVGQVKESLGRIRQHLGGLVLPLRLEDFGLASQDGALALDVLGTGVYGGRHQP